MSRMKLMSTKFGVKRILSNYIEAKSQLSKGGEAQRSRGKFSLTYSTILAAYTHPTITITQYKNTAHK